MTDGIGKKEFQYAPSMMGLHAMDDCLRKRRYPLEERMTKSLLQIEAELEATHEQINSKVMPQMMTVRHMGKIPRSALYSMEKRH